MKQTSGVLAFVLSAAVAVRGQEAPQDALVTPAPRIRAVQVRQDVGDLTFGDPRFEGWQTLDGDSMFPSLNHSLLSPNSIDSRSKNLQLRIHLLLKRRPI